MAAAPPILPVKPDINIEPALSPLPAALAGSAFQEGLSFNSAECTAMSIGTWPSGCAPSLEEQGPLADEDEDVTWKAVGQFGDTVEFKPFYVYLFLSCGNGFLEGGIDARRAELLRASFAAGRHAGLARQLWYGAANPQNTGPSLRDSATVPTGWDTTNDALIVIAKLLDAHKAKMTGTTLIHGPWILVPYLKSLNLLTVKGGVLQGDGWTYVVDVGYPLTGNAGPVLVADPDPADTTYYADVPGTGWLYASGRVEYAWGGEIDNQSLGLSYTESPDLSRYTVWESRTNRSLIRVEQQAFLRFDPCSVLAHRVDLPTIEP